MDNKLLTLGFAKFQTLLADYQRLQIWMVINPADDTLRSVLGQLRRKSITPTVHMKHFINYLKGDSSSSSINTCLCSLSFVFRNPTIEDKQDI